MTDVQLRARWEQRLRRIDAELAERTLSPAQARERYRMLGWEYVGGAADSIAVIVPRRAPSDGPAET